MVHLCVPPHVFCQLVQSFAAFQVPPYERWTDASSFWAGLLQAILGLAHYLFPSGVQNIASFVNITNHLLFVLIKWNYLTLLYYMLVTMDHQSLSSRRQQGAMCYQLSIYCVSGWQVHLPTFGMERCSRKPSESKDWEWEIELETVAAFKSALATHLNQRPF